MSDLITFSKLSALVSENSGIELSVCEAFIRNLTQTVISGLAEGEHIRIKDFGFFELRQSPGNTDVEFVPESSFAERVNTPYAHLRPAAASMNSPRQYPEAPQSPQSKGCPPAQPQQTPQSPYMPQQPETPQPQVYPPAQPQQTPQSPYMPQQPETPSSIFPDKQYYQQNDQNISDQGQETPREAAAYMTLKDTGQPTHEGNTHDAGYSSYRRRNAEYHGRKLPQLSTNKKYVLIGVMGLITGFFIGYFAGSNSSSSDDKKDSASVENAAEDPSILAAAPVSQDFDYESSVNVADIDTLMDENTSMDEDTTGLPAETKETPVQTVKLQKGQRLSDIALKYYGKKEYWVYIYLDNRETIKNPFTVREGAVLNIPPKDKYAPTTNEETNFQWAKTKGAEINNKYSKN